MHRLIALLACACLAWAATVRAADESISAAEQRLFLDPHLANLSESTTVTYSYAKSGSMEPAFEDVVRLQVAKGETGRHAHVDYLSDKRAFSLPDVEPASGNPVILAFLERDVREMQRLTGGQANYFRKRVRLALAEHAQLETAAIELDGHKVDAVVIRIQPFLDDPLRGRFPGFVGKTYTFTLSPRVPGMLYEMRSGTPDPKGGPGKMLMEERLIFTGTQP